MPIQTPSLKHRPKQNVVATARVRASSLRYALLTIPGAYFCMGDADDSGTISMDRIVPIQCERKEGD